MIEELRFQEASKQIAEEAFNLEALKLKMEMIKQSAHVLNADGKGVYHDSAIRSGGYYMFDDDNVETEACVSTTSERKVYFRTPQISPTDTSSDSSVSRDSVKGEKTKKVKNFFVKCYRKVVNKMHEMSRDYSHILKVMHEERRSLMDSLSPEARDSKHNL